MTFFPSSLVLDLRPLLKKIGPGVMTQRCVIERRVQRKTDQKLIFNGNYTQIVFFVFFFFFFFFFCFRIHFHYVLSYLFGLFGVRTCVSILWHTSLPKKQLLLEKIAKNHDFGDFSWFSCFLHDVTYDVTVASYKVCVYFFWYQWTREGHSYPLVPHNWCFVNRFPRSWGGIRPQPRLWDGSKKPDSFRVKCLQREYLFRCEFIMNMMKAQNQKIIT